MTLVLPRFLAVFCAMGATLLAAGTSPGTEHVFIISIDGGKPAVIARSEMPTLRRMIAEGASTWMAMTILPSLTLPSHTSMLTGVAPDRHHIVWNTWQPRRGVVSVPTIFAEAKKAGLSTAMFVGKAKFRHLLQPGTVDEFEFDESLPAEMDQPILFGLWHKKRSTVSAKTVAEEAAQYIGEKKPNLCFIHFTDPDDAGHKHGWGSMQQIKAFADVDAALAEVLQAIEAAGINGESVVIVTADHGGHRKTHGTYISDDMHIPWIAWGKSVRESSRISGPVATYDTAATALWLLGVPRPELFDGKPVKEAFAASEETLGAIARNRSEAGNGP
jgi:predicted AlkP superfamily pyrophosphatase or phosphodiesterase